MHGPWELHLVFVATGEEPAEREATWKRAGLIASREAHTRHVILALDQALSEASRLEFCKLINAYYLLRCIQEGFFCHLIKKATTDDALV